MKKNVGGFDGFFRALVAVICVILAVGVGYWWLLFPAAVLIVTNYLMYCPLYELVGLNFAEEKNPSIK